MKKFSGCFWLFFFLTVFLAGDKHEKNQLKIGMHTFPPSLNPVYVTDEASQAVVNKIFDSLFYFDEGGNIKNGLVAGYRLSADQPEIWIDLKRNCCFSDGKELDAKDVAATFFLLGNEKIKYPYRSMLLMLADMKPTGRYSLKLILRKKTALWKNLLTFKILNSRDICAVDAVSFRNKILSGTGPYRLKSSREPIGLVLDINPYYRGKSLYSSIRYLVISDTRLKPLKLLNDEIDICELQPEDALAYQKITNWKKKFVLLKYRKFGYTYLVFNLGNNAVTRNVRRIFYNRLVTGDFVERFLKHRGEPVKTPFLLFNHREKPVAQPTDKLNESVNLKIITNSESRLRKEFVLFLKQDLESVNIILEPQFLEYHTFMKCLKNGEFDLGISGFLLDIDYDLKDVFSSESAFNYGHFSHQQMDELLEAGLLEMEPDKRVRIYEQANRIWREELPLIPLFNLFYYMAVSRKIPVPENVCQLMGSTSDFLINIQDWKAY